MVLFWKYQGAASSDARRNIKELVQLHRVQILIVVQPRISVGTADEVIRSLSFDNHTKVDALGFSRVIWILWKSFVCSVDVVCSSRQFVSLIIDDGKKLRLALTAVYASPSPSIRDLFWNYL